MTTWTEAAREELERYLTQARPALEAAGADAAEVTEDLRQHVRREAEESGLSVVTAEDVRRLLTRLGAPAAPADAPEPEKSARAPSKAPARNDPDNPKAGLGWSWTSAPLIIFGVLLPVIALVLELAAGMCAELFFDPLPSVPHVALVLLVPAANFLAWWAVARGLAGWRKPLGWLNGLALGVGIFYTIIFLPLMPFGIVAVLIYGIGFLPWAPASGLISAFVLRRHLRRLGGPEAIPLPGLWRGLALAWLALIVLEAPVWFTRAGLQMAAAEDIRERHLGLRLLRVWHDEDILRRACYGRSRGAANLDLVGWIVGGGRDVPANTAREIYYRVTGAAFNSRPAPEVRTARGPWLEMGDWTWDADQGGEQVGGRIKGLTLLSSRLDAAADARAATAYTEWTLEFRNQSQLPREARAQILLPPGGVVSRLTLWVNGEEREAAFAGRGQTRAAYQKIAVQQQRDPVLVTTAGPDRVLMQCFPIPPNGGVMKVRLGITSPLVLPTASTAVFRWPRVVERNFSVLPETRHSAWLEASGVRTLTSKVLRPASAKPGTLALSGSLSEGDLSSAASRVELARDASAVTAWTFDDRSQPPGVVRQTIITLTNAAPPCLVVAVDGSRRMRESLPQIARALEQLPESMDLVVLVGADEPQNLSAAPAGRIAKADRQTVLRRLARWNAVGGHDNAPLLRLAGELAAARQGVVLWVHAAQPVLLESPGFLQQWSERGGGMRVHEFAVEPGPNRLLEALDGLATLSAWPRVDDLDKDLTRCLHWLSGQAGLLQPQRQRQPGTMAPAAETADQTGSHLARLWASEEIQRLRVQRQLNPAVALAARYHLVTPISGAVVLENQQQYRETGLNPVDPETVPSIPEPRAWMLLALGLAAVVRWRAKRAAIGR